MSASPQRDRLRVAVAGASGRMGQMLIEAVLDADDLQLHAALDVDRAPSIGRDAGATLGRTAGVAVSADVDSALRGADVLIDFTRPQGTMAHLEACARHGVKLVIGTTGLSETHKRQIADQSRSLAIVMAPNMSVGVNVVLKLLDVAAHAFSEGYDIEVIEAHHRHKVDAPSGTALKMGEVLAHALGRNLQDCAVYARQGVTGERQPTTIGFSSIRGGDIVGDHTVLFAGTGERVEITHRSSSRAGYAQGSLRAARFLADKPRGLYGMEAVLGL